MGPWENSSLWYTTIKIEWNEAAEMKLMEDLPSPTAKQNGAKKIVNLYLIKRGNIVLKWSNSKVVSFESNKH